MITILDLWCTYQVDNASRSSLVFDTLGIEQQALASLTGPSSVGVSGVNLFGAQEVGQ